MQLKIYAEFPTRFSELESLKTKFRLFSTPFDVDEKLIP